MSEHSIVFIKGIGVEMSNVPFENKNRFDMGRSVIQVYDVSRDSTPAKRDRSSVFPKIVKKPKLDEEVKGLNQDFLKIYSKLMQESCTLDMPPIVERLKTTKRIQNSENVNENPSNAELPLEPVKISKPVPRPIQRQENVSSSLNAPAIEKSDRISDSSNFHDSKGSIPKSLQEKSSEFDVDHLLSELQKRGGLSYKQRKFLVEKGYSLSNQSRPQHRPHHNHPPRREYRNSHPTWRNSKPAPKSFSMNSNRIDVESMRNELPGIERIYIPESNWKLHPQVVEISYRKIALEEYHSSNTNQRVLE